MLFRALIHSVPIRRVILAGAVLVMCKLAVAFVDPPAEEPVPNDVADAPLQPGTVACANLVYGDSQTSVCYSPEFLAETGRRTNIVTEKKFTPVRLDSPRLYQYPFAVWTGQGDFTLTAEQRTELRNYLTNGGFIVASAGCSSPEWIRSCRSEIARAFPEVALKAVDFSHPLFHTVHDIARLECKRAGKAAVLEGLEIDGRVVLIFSSDGLNDTTKAEKGCCCCGGNEISNARDINVNLLAYALTH